MWRKLRYFKEIECVFSLKKFFIGYNYAIITKGVIWQDLKN